MPPPYTEEDKRRAKEIFDAEKSKNVLWSDGPHKATGIRDTMFQFAEADREPYYEAVQRERLRGGNAHRT